MKTVRALFIVLSALFLFFQVVAYLSLISDQTYADLSSPPAFVGFNFFFFLSVLFAFLAWKWNRKIKRKKAEVLLEFLANDKSEDDETNTFKGRMA